MYINGDTCIMKKIIEIHDALMSLLPENTAFAVEDNDYTKIDIQTEGVTLPSKEEVEAEMARLQAIEDAIEYQHNRKAAYPNIGDQLDMLWHAIDNGTLDKTSDFYTTLKGIKDNYPKP